MFGPEYVRYPIVVGCKGVVFPADAYLGGVSGIGGGTADLALPANLSALVFFPVGNSGWAASEAPTKLVLYGPDGAIIRTADKASSLTVSMDGAQIKVPAGKSLQITSLPTTPAGLPAGSLWVDGGSANVVKAV